MKKTEQTRNRSVVLKSKRDTTIDILVMKSR